MSRQGELFSDFGREHVAQQQFGFATGPRLSSMTCAECGAALEETPSGFVCCPRGHGKLIQEPRREEGK